MTRRALLVAVTLLLAACATGASDDGVPAPFRYPPAPRSPAADEPTAPDARAAIGELQQWLPTGSVDDAAVAALGETGDVRHAWYVADLLRFTGGADGERLVDAFERLTGVSIDADPDADRNPWQSVTNHLIAWDVPAYPDYLADKADLFLRVEPAWEPFFVADADIDWRHVSWGGVLIDDRELGDTGRCPGGCIPALDDFPTTDAAGGDWYPDDRVVFGVEIGDETLAVPQNVAEVHEMFNFSLGGRRVALPYCTLCGSAQAYLTDSTGAAEVPVLRTSGLLIRSNKISYDLRTRSVIDTFTGEAVSGPLRDDGVVLDEVSVVRSTWGAWKAEHPGTRIVAEDGGLGRSYPLDPLRGRDDDGPIFPIGDVDDRLDGSTLVVGVIAVDGSPVAVPSDALDTVLTDAAAGDEGVTFAGVRFVAAGDGVRAFADDEGVPLATHEAFWFAWSQFHPDTELVIP